MRQDTPPGHRDDVGGGAADVDQEAGWDPSRDVEGGRHPVRGREVQRTGQGLLDRGEPAVHPEDGERRPREGRSQSAEDHAHALAPGREDVRELGGHGDRSWFVAAQPQVVRDGSYDLTQVLGRAPDLERPDDRLRLPDRRVAPPDARRLDVHAAYVPPGDDAGALSHLLGSD